MAIVAIPLVAFMPWSGTGEQEGIPPFGGGGNAAFIPFPDLDACARNTGTGIHTGRGRG